MQKFASTKFPRNSRIHTKIKCSRKLSVIQYRYTCVVFSGSACILDGEIEWCNIDIMNRMYYTSVCYNIVLIHIFLFNILCFMHKPVKLESSLFTVLNKTLPEWCMYRLHTFWVGNKCKCSLIVIHKCVQHFRVPMYKVYPGSSVMLCVTPQKRIVHYRLGMKSKVLGKILS